MDINQENGKQDRESHAQTVRDQEKRNRESRNRNGQGRENRVQPDSARAARRMTPYEQYLQHRRKKRTGRIIFWVIIIEAVCLLIGAVVLFFPKEDPEIEELITKKVQFEYQTETDRVITYGVAVPRPNIDVQLLSINDWSRPGIKVDKIRKIVVHYLGNPETSAQENRDYFESLKYLQDTYMSANYVVGTEGEIIQCVPDGEVAWASNKANYYSISIENCHHDESGRFTDATYWSDVHLVAYLTEKYDLERDDIIRHYDVTGKDCPKWYVEHPGDWEQFKDDVMTYREECRAQQMKMLDELLQADVEDETEQDVLREYLDSLKPQTEVQMETSNQDLWEDLKKRAEKFGDH